MRATACGGLSFPLPETSLRPPRSARGLDFLGRAPTVSGSPLGDGRRRLAYSAGSLHAGLPQTGSVS